MDALNWYENEGVVKKAASRFLAVAPAASPEDRSEAVRRLAAHVAADDLKRADLTATICGSLVEKGADPAPLEEPLLERFVPALRQLAEQVAQEPIATAEVPAEDPAQIIIEQPEQTETGVRNGKPMKRPGLLRTLWRLAVASRKLRRAMREQQRLAAARPVSEVEATVNALGGGAIAMFSASPALRTAHPEVRDLARALSGRVDCCGWLDSVFEVLEDEPLLVIEPSTERGILARLSGVDVNFTLTMLLMHGFPGEDGKPHSRLSEKAASVLRGDAQQVCEQVTGVWNLYNWPAIDERGGLPPGQANSKHWIWNEGKPADIAVFEGRRVVLLGPPAYTRTWQAERTFAAMRPQLRIEKVLTPDEVRGWLAKMIAARPGNPQV